MKWDKPAKETAKIARTLDRAIDPDTLAPPEREAWFDEDGVVPDGSVTTIVGWGIDMQDVLGLR